MKLSNIFNYILLAFVLLIVFLLFYPLLTKGEVLVVQSGSMEPSIKQGSIVVIYPVEEYMIGDVISFDAKTKEGIPVTHRIDDAKVIEDEFYFITKGDANSEADAREVSKEDIIGKVFVSIPYLGYVLDFAKKPLGFAIIIILPAIFIVFGEAKKIYGEVKRENNKE